MSEMIERVGERLRKECLDVFGATWNYDIAWRFARAAIEEMREPSSWMLNEAVQIYEDQKGNVAGFEYWQRMVDTALKEQEGEKG